MAVVTQTGSGRTLAVIASCLLGGVVGALLHGALYEKHGWFSGFGFAFGAVVLGLIASVVVDFGLPLVAIVWTGAAPAPPPAAGAAAPAQGAPATEPVATTGQYPAAIFSLQLLIAFLTAVASAAFVWGVLQLVGRFTAVPPGLGLMLGILALGAGAAAGWRAGYGLARLLDLTAE